MPNLQDVYAELLRQCFNTYKAVRSTAVSAVTSAAKRFPCLAPPALAVALRATAKLPRLSDDELWAWLHSKGAREERVFEDLAAEVFAKQKQASLPAPATQSAAGGLA